MWFILEKFQGSWRIVNSYEPIATEQEAKERIVKVMRIDSTREFTLAEMRSAFSAETVIHEIKL